MHEINKLNSLIHCSREELDQIEEFFIEILGYEQFLTALLRQMSHNEKASAFEFLARMYEIEFGVSNEEE